MRFLTSGYDKTYVQKKKLQKLLKNKAQGPNNLSIGIPLNRNKSNKLRHLRSLDLADSTSLVDCF